MHYGPRLRGAQLEKLTDTLTHICWNAILAPDEAERLTASGIASRSDDENSDTIFVG